MCTDGHKFDWHSTSRGPSVMAELLVLDWIHPLDRHRLHPFLNARSKWAGQKAWYRTTNCMQLLGVSDIKINALIKPSERLTHCSWQLTSEHETALQVGSSLCVWIILEKNKGCEIFDNVHRYGLVIDYVWVINANIELSTVALNAEERQKFSANRIDDCCINENKCPSKYTNSLSKQQMEGNKSRNKSKQWATCCVWHVDSTNCWCGRALSVQQLTTNLMTPACWYDSEICGRMWLLL